jgi:hypothetical protein
MRRPFPVLVALLMVATAACTVRNPSPGASSAATPVTVDWRPVALPVTGDGRAAPRDAVNCAGTWYVVGAVITPDGGIRPAVWSARDAATFAEVPLDAHTFYGRQNLLYTVGCRDGRIAAVGAKSGGAHGNPRVATWYQRDDGSLTEVEAYFELYGGGDHVGVSHIAGGPAGWVIAGNRVSGAAVWVSADAHEFELIEYGGGKVSGITGETASPAPSVSGSPGTGSNPDPTAAADVVATPDGWIVVGSVLPAGRTGRDAAAWSSAEGRGWTRQAVPSVDGDDALLRVAAVAGGLLAVGVRGDAFGAWTRGDEKNQWVAAGTFGRSRGQIAAGVGGIAPFGDRVLVATEAAGGRQVWVTDPVGRTFTPVTPPAAVPAGGDTALTVAGAGGVVLLIADDGRAGGVWLAGGP